MSDDVPIVVATRSGAVTSHVLGSKDQVFVAINMNKIGRGIFAKSEIKSAEDLRGKTGWRPRGGLTSVGARYRRRDAADDAAAIARSKMGFREFDNYDALGIIFPANTVTTRRLISWTKARRHG
jgi:hypothetical protein